MADFRHALDKVRLTGNLLEAARAREGVGDCHQANGEHGLAWQHLEDARQAYADIRAEAPSGHSDPASNKTQNPGGLRDALLNGHSDEPRQNVGRPALCPLMTDLGQAPDAARAIAVAALGRDPGPMATAQSSSHYVYVSSDVVVKIIDAGGHSRLDREITLVPCLPAGLTAPLLGSGLCRLGTRDVRYACYARVPGVPPGMGMPGVDGVTARLLAEEAVRRLDGLHSWMPAGHAGQTLGEPLDHGGFISQAALFAEVDNLAALDRDGIMPRHLLDGLTAIAERAPLHARAAVPVHADCHWGNWLACDRSVTALLDFEWARFGEPVDDWFFLARFSGPHMETVLDVIARATTTSPETLRAECEVREATYLASDLRVALEHPDAPARMAADRLRELEELIVGRYWWRHTR